MKVSIREGRRIVSVFAPTRYRVVKIVCSCFEVVLQTTKHTIGYHGLGLLLEGNIHMSSGLILKMNSGYNGMSRELEKFTK
jgi:hypothetical protein